jgi:hypothetical protein
VLEKLDLASHVGSKDGSADRSAHSCARFDWANSAKVRALDSLRGRSYLLFILIHRLTGGAFVRASAFRLEMGLS